MSKLIHTSLLLAVFVASSKAFSQTPPTPKAATKGTAPKIDLGLPKMGELPTLESAKPKTDTPTPPPAETVASVTLVRVLHGVGWADSADGRRPSVEMKKLQLSPGGMTPRFSSVVRVKNVKKRSVAVHIEVLDAKGGSIMESQGQVSFKQGVEGEWQVDWDPTRVRFPGQCQVSVDLNGEAPQAFPIDCGGTP